MSIPKIDYKYPTGAQLEGGGDLPCPFAKFLKKCPDFG